VGGRPGAGDRGPGISTLPALGAGLAGGALGAGLANRLGDRPQASLPGLGDHGPGGLGDRGPGASQLPANSIGDRRDALSDRLGGGDRDQLGQDRLQNREDRLQNRDDRQQTRGDRQDNRQQTRDDRQEGRQENRGDRQETRNERQDNRQETRNERQENRQETRGDRQENRQEQRADRQQTRQENRADRQESWQEQRDQIRQDWQDYRDQAREDWQGWLEDNYGMYGDWYSGYAPGYWGQWDYLWDNHPVAAAVGLTWWGANAIGSLFGYADYSNPYYTDSMPACYTEPLLPEIYYSEPTTVNITTEHIQQAAAPATQTPGASAPAGQAPGVSSEALTKFDEARAAFFEGHYEQALKLTDAAVAQLPHDAVLHEFRSLVLFALARYPESAATIHPVLDVGPGWDWKTLSGLYPSTDVYSNQLRALEAARNKDPKAADLRFLLGYHYLTCGYTDQALTEFRRALELQPNDSVAASLVATLSPRDAQLARPAPAVTAKAVPPDSLVGNWTAAGKDGSRYSMSLRKDGSFTWGFTKGKRKQEVKGVHTVEENILAMEPDSGGVLLAELTLKDPDTLHFKMIGGAKDDPGLTFQRGQSR
jgi:Tetratricopeptide repeat